MSQSNPSLPNPENLSIPLRREPTSAGAPISPPLTTDALDDRGYFDPRYTCDCDNSSPELRWGTPPDGTHRYALIAEDLSLRSAEQKPFVHWVIYNIPENLHHLPAGIPPQDSFQNGIRQGINSLGKLGYSGPCPPRGDQAHRYVIRLYALSDLPEVPHRATYEQMMDLIRPRLLATSEIIGKYQRMVERTG